MLQGSRESPAIKGYEWFRNKIVSKKKNVWVLPLVLHCTLYACRQWGRWDWGTKELHKVVGELLCPKWIPSVDS